MRNAEGGSILPHSAFGIPNSAFLIPHSVFLPRIPGPDNLSRDLLRVGVRNRFELLHPPVETVREIQIPELIGRHAVRATETSGLRPGRAPAVQEVPLLVEFQDA